MLNTQQPDGPQGGEPTREQMSIVVIGHVDHGKSTLIGRLLADTGSLPEGKLERLRDECRRNAKPFEYAFLLDALGDEQSQGITIDSARCFFHTAQREYIIIDAPGHIEFLKNMISGAARAEAGLLLIDANEGVQENSRRHGYLMSLLGIRQLAVCVNKMDLVDYSQAAFDRIRQEYLEFLQPLGMQPLAFLPVSSREGDGVVSRSAQMPWYDGPTVLHVLDGFEKEPPPLEKALRMPVQDVYKFTAEGDDRRIVAGRIETGRAHVGDGVVFLPSGKRSRIASVEAFNRRADESVSAGQCTGLTLAEQVYIRPGELMCRADEARPQCGTRLKVNLFWMGRRPMIMNKRYKLKLCCHRTPVWLTEVHSVLDASNLSTEHGRRQIERHDVAECELETVKRFACDLAADIPQTGRFVIIDNYEIAGGGVILDVVDRPQDNMVARHVARRERAWEHTSITPGMRAGRYNQRSAFVVVAGPVGTGKKAVAQRLEEALFERGRMVYYLGLSNALLGVDSDLAAFGERDEHLRRLGEMAHLLADAGMVVITTVSDLDDEEIDLLKALSHPSSLLLVSVGEDRLDSHEPDLAIEASADVDEAVKSVRRLLHERSHLIEYYL